MTSLDKGYHYSSRSTVEALQYQQYCWLDNRVWHASCAAGKASHLVPVDGVGIVVEAVAGVERGEAVGMCK